MGELGEELVGVDEEHGRRSDDGHDGERRQAADAAPHDAVQQHQPDHEDGDLDEFEPVVVVAPQVDERRQQQGPTPGIGQRAEGSVRIEDREPVVGEHGSDVAVEEAAGLAQVQSEVVALRVAVAVQLHREDAGTDHDDAERHGAQPARGGQRDGAHRVTIRAA